MVNILILCIYCPVTEWFLRKKTEWKLCVKMVTLILFWPGMVMRLEGDHQLLQMAASLQSLLKYLL